MNEEDKLYCGSCEGGMLAVYCEGNWIDTDYSCGKYPMYGKCRYCISKGQFEEIKKELK